MEAPRWRLGTKIAFRFACIYFSLYTLFIPMQFVPPLQPLFDKYNRLWQLIVPWVAQHILHLRHDFRAFVINPIGGSQDTTFAYVEVFCYFLVALAGTVLWS